MTNPLFDEMQAAAEKATPGRWRVAIEGNGGSYPVAGEDAMELACIPSCCFDALDIFGPDRGGDCDPLPNATHIALHCPTNAIALHNAYKAMEKRVEELEAILAPVARIGRHGEEIGYKADAENWTVYAPPSYFRRAASLLPTTEPAKETT